MIRILFHARRRRGLPTKRTSLVVLGTAQYDGRPSRQFAARLDHAALLWHHGLAERVYVLGGKLPGDRFTEAGVGTRYLVACGVPAEVITPVPEGNDTKGSYRALVEKHDPGTTTIITDPHHALRAEILARRAGLDATASPTQTSPARFPRRTWWLTLFHEAGGMAVIDVSRLVGDRAADRVEAGLRRLQARLRPSRRARHDVLAAEQN